MSNIRLLVDMDEVIVDFVGGACDIFGVSVEKMQEHRALGSWTIVPALGEALDTPLTEDEFWKEIHRHGQAFWEELEELPWALDLIKLVESVTDDWHIVSAPSEEDTSYTGKARWLKDYFGKGFDRFALTPHKHIFASPNAILIDDRERNVNRFVQAGGRGLVFPTYGNQLHFLASDPLHNLRERLDNVMKGNSDASPPIP